MTCWLPPLTLATSLKAYQQPYAVPSGRFPLVPASQKNWILLSETLDVLIKQRWGIGFVLSGDIRFLFDYSHWLYWHMPAAKGIPINELPDFPAIRQIADALWNASETRGAAVLIGAGFSRNAVLPSPKSRKPPLWTDFTRVMREALYAGRREATSDPLKLAEEYKAALGATALDNLIYDLVPDGEWQPGSLHSKLIDLPWTDVLTTNWDTLLERAAQITTREDTYAAVRAIADIPRTRSPRVVKLHGSMPSNRPFIFTEEDYRTYPRRFAPFVNLVQQVLMENELCLLGFSGEDPNFLQWSGWIRDQLGDAARRIYLVGVLNLSPAYRKYLEARKVTPVDLAPAVSSVVADKHAEAARMFLEFLRIARPRPNSHWLSELGTVESQRLAGVTSNNASVPAMLEAFEKVMTVWREERQRYGGWVVCPFTDRLRIRSELGFHEHALRKVFEHLQPERQAQVLLETAWRFDLVFSPVSQWFQKLLASALQDANNGLTHVQRSDIAAILARTAREERDRPNFEKWIAFLKQNSAGDKDVLATAAYGECLWARDHLDYATIDELIPSISGEDPVWKMRRAAILFELGETESATGLIIECRNDLRERFNKDPKSIWTMSRLAWAIYLARAAMSSSRQSEIKDSPSSEEWPPYFARNKCLPWDELEYLDREISEEFQREVEAAQKQQPTFEAGSYTETIHFSSSSGWAVHEVLKISDLVGLPLMVGFVDVMRSRVARSLGLSKNRDEGDFLCIIRSLRSSSDKLLDRAFSRIEVARMPLAMTQSLSDSVSKEIDFCRARHVRLGSTSQEIASFWVERMGVLVEVLSRMVVRLESQKAIGNFRKAASLAAASDLGYWILFEPLGKLLDRSLSAVSPKQREALLPEIVSIPLPDERGIEARTNEVGPYDKWPEAMVNLILDRAERPADATGFPLRIAVLISKAAGADRLTRQRAIVRLFRLHEMGTLTENEVALFARAVWSQRQSAESLPQNTGLLSHALFKLPAPDGVDLPQLFRTNVLDKVLAGPVDPDQIAEIVGATNKRRHGSKVFELSADEAARLFNTIIEWQPRRAPLDLDHYNDRMNRNLGLAVIHAVMPFVDVKSLTTEGIGQLLKRVETGSLASVLIALPDIVRSKPDIESRAIGLIHRACFSNEPDNVHYGIGAIDRWRILKKQGSVNQVPKRVIEIAVAAASWARAPWLSSALYLAHRLVEDGYLENSDKEGLATRLEILRTETAYSSWDTTDMRTVNITQIRQRCVRLAEALRKAGLVSEAISYWLEITKTDPLPEVRYALDEQDH